MTSAPIILVPGFWLGAWAWDEVADALRADGHDVTALTLPGLESADADRSAITAADHVDAITDDGPAAGAPVVLAVHSGTGFSGYAASDRVPELIAAMVYVDTGAGVGAMHPDFATPRGRSPRRRSSRRTRTIDGLSGTVVEYYELAFNGKQPEEAVEKYVGSRYTQHNPQAADGTEASSGS